MKRYPLQTLLRLRAHRTDKARLVVLEKRAAVRTCQEACERIQGAIRALEAERASQRQRLSAPPPEGQPWAVAMEQRQAHIDLLGEQVVAEQGRLAKAREQLAAAERELEQARQEWTRARAREDALEQRRDAWQGEQRALQGRREEEAAADLVQARARTTMEWERDQS